jgi:polysaccharide export outer membrane protein
MLLQFVIVAILGLGGCASGTGSAPSQQRNPSTSEPARLSSLWQERTRSAKAMDFAIGPGDVIEITVPGLEELEQLEVRVSAEGAIELPLIGQVQAAGRTEGELRTEIRDRLEARYMYNPPVNLFVSEYRSRLVGVIGAVANPGFYPLVSASDTLLDAIALAGGMSALAAPRIQLIPASPDAANTAVPALPDVQALKEGAGRERAFVIELASVDEGAPFLNLPARPGDVIVVLERGEVMVNGWVRRPGPYPITPSLTVLGAVAAAGGPEWAAKRRDVSLIRSTKHGSNVTLDADLDRISGGDQPDIQVEAGDVIRVPSTWYKAAATGFYRFVVTVFSIGFGRGL